MKTWAPWCGLGSSLGRKPHARGRLRARRPRVEDLEARVVLSTATAEMVPARFLAAETSRLPRRVAAAAIQADIQPNGDVLVVTPGDGNDNTDEKTYRNLNGTWSLVQWNHWAPVGEMSVWLEESWSSDGTLVQQAYANRASNANLYFQVRAGKNTLTLTVYGADGLPIYWGAHSELCQDATATWIYGRAANGGRGPLLQYHVDESDAISAADWVNQAVYKNPAYYASGWLQWYPNNYSVKVPPPIQTGLNDLRPFVNAAGVAQRQGISTVAVPTGLTAQRQTVGGNLVTTFWNAARTESIAFTYNGNSTKSLREQTYGSAVGGKWVTVADHSSQFIRETVTYTRPGGQILSSQRVFTASNGRTATLNGTWTSGTSLDNATGTETGTNYLTFRAVTIQYRAGTPLTRYGTLQYDTGGGTYAVDTYNGAGTAIVKRLASQSQGSPVTQTWTVTGRNNVIVSWNNPDPSTTRETTVWQWNVPNSGMPGYTLMNFTATLSKPVLFVFRNGDSVQLTTYNWRAFLSYDRGSASWNWNYRQWAQVGRQHNASPYPSAYIPFSTTPQVVSAWNQV